MRKARKRTSSFRLFVQKRFRKFHRRDFLCEDHQSAPKTREYSDMNPKRPKLKFKLEIVKKIKKLILPGGESNPGLPRDRRGYLPLY